MAHLICELAVRLDAVGRFENASFHLPLTQNELADVVGLSPVHVNRVLKELRGDGVIAWVNYVIRIIDWPRLAEIAEFNPNYLGFGGGDGRLNHSPTRNSENPQPQPAER